MIAAIIQSIPIISPLDPSTAIMPLAFILIVSMIREGVEDYGRYKSDLKMNRETCKKFKTDLEDDKEA